MNITRFSTIKWSGQDSGGLWRPANAAIFLFERGGGTIFAPPGSLSMEAGPSRLEEHPMNGIIYIVGLIVVIMFILSFLGLR